MERKIPGSNSELGFFKLVIYMTWTAIFNLVDNFDEPSRIGCHDMWAEALLNGR